MRIPYLSIISAIVVYVLMITAVSAYANSLTEGTTSQDSSDQQASGINLVPVLGYSPETRAMGGLALMYYFRAPGDELNVRPSSIMSISIYTQNKQTSISLVPDIYFRSGEYRASCEFRFIEFPLFFYGIGNNTSLDDEEEYAPRSFEMKFSIQRRVYSDLNFGLVYEYEHGKLIEIKDNGMLIIGPVLGVEGGSISGAGFQLNWDNRDNLFYSTTGGYYEASAVWFDDVLGSDYIFGQYKIDVRHYVPIWEGHSMAFQALMHHQNGDLPFNRLALLGGSSAMRGHYEGRYRDISMWVTQVEYRVVPLWWRFGLVGFAGFGDVSDRLAHFRLDEAKYSVGWGIRYILNREEGITIRLDVGYCDDQSGVYIDFLEAF